MKTIILICLCTIATCQAFAQNPPLNTSLLRLQNYTGDTTTVVNTGHIRYDFVTGKYRFWNTVTDEWFSYAPAYAFTSGLIESSGTVSWGGALTGNTTISGAHALAFSQVSSLAVGHTSASARFNVRGSGTTSSTSNARFDNSAGTMAFSVRDDGAVLFGAGSEGLIFRTSDGYAPSISSDGMAFRLAAPQSGVPSLTFNKGSTGTNEINNTANDRIFLGSIVNSLQFNPTMGSANFYYFKAGHRINQTGTATGTVIGWDYDPTVASVLGSHIAYRATSGALLIGGTTLTTGSVLADFQSTSKGILLPRVTNLASVSSPVNGMTVYDASTDRFGLYQESAWHIPATITGSNYLMEYGDGSGALTAQYSPTGTGNFQGVIPEIHDGPNNTTYYVEATIVVTEDGGNTGGATKIAGVFHKNNSSVVSQIGATTVIVPSTEDIAGDLTVSFVIDDDLPYISIVTLSETVTFTLKQDVIKCSN